MTLYLCAVSRMRKYICIKNQLGRYYLQRLSCNRALPIGLIAENGSKVANNVDNAKNKASCKENRKKRVLDQKIHAYNWSRTILEISFVPFEFTILYKKRELIFLCRTLFILNQKRLGIFTFCTKCFIRIQGFCIRLISF